VLVVEVKMGKDVIQPYRRTSQAEVRREQNRTEQGAGVGLNFPNSKHRNRFLATATRQQHGINMSVAGIEEGEPRSASGD
jgi:hypothetical protein